MTTTADHPYQSYRNLPSLAGLATVTEAARPGLAVGECVDRLKRYHYAFLRLHEILNGRITAEPIYELKTGFSHHAYLCAEHVQALRTRVGEMREPPLGLDKVPDPGLELFFDEIRSAPTTGQLLLGIYEKAMPALDAALARHQVDTHPLTDAPSLRVCRFARLELADMITFGKACIAALVDDALRKEASSWLAHLDACLGSAGSIDGTAERCEQPTASPESRAFTFDLVPQRDERFQDLYNQAVNPEAFLYDEQYDARPKTLMMLFKRLREIDVPEMMATIIAQTKGKPWGYYRDMARQLWDEARHAMMGEVGFVALGVDWTQARITHNWSLRLNTECSPMERHAVLFFIEQGLMPRTGKRFEWEVAIASGDPLVRTFQDFDWADEVLHAQIGRQWYVPDFGDLKKALAYGDECWSRILSNWTTVRDQGLTTHANWWPTIYQQACQTWGVEPDPKVLAYHTTYEAQRADLKAVTGSA
jgi:hypothetical protein